MYNEALSEQLALVGLVNAGLRDNTTAATGWIDMKNIRRVLFLCNVGATDIVADFKLRSALDGSGTTPLDISGKVATQWSATDDNKVSIIEITAEEVGILGVGRTFIEGLATIGDGTLGANVCVMALAGFLRYSDASENDLAAVKEIIR